MKLYFLKCFTVIYTWYVFYSCIFKLNVNVQLNINDWYIYIYTHTHARVLSNASGKYTHLTFLLMVLFKSGVVPNKLPSYDFECPTIYLLSISFGINFPEPNKHKFYSEVFIYKNFLYQNNYCFIPTIEYWDWKVLHECPKWRHISFSPQIQFTISKQQTLLNIFSFNKAWS